ncbi:MAG TPA: 30S ribosomal protein S6 [Pirellulales bacterium]|nr:30S ribosomal protein S6 [Pirellulales bacterium]
MAQHVYEGLFIFDSNRYSRDAGGVSGQIAEFIRKCGGEMIVSRLWEERRLAYPINGQRKGTYWLSYFKLDSRQLVTIERECQLSESVLRCLLLKVDPRIVDALVSHATSSAGDPAKSRRVETAPVPVEAVVEDVVEEEQEEVAELN